MIPSENKLDRIVRAAYEARTRALMDDDDEQEKPLVKPEEPDHQAGSILPFIKANLHRIPTDILRAEISKREMHEETGERELIEIL